METPLANGKETPDVTRRDSKVLRNNTFTAEMLLGITAATKMEK